MSFHFYILFSAQLNNYYIGYTGDELTERLRRHNSDHAGFTGPANDWTIVYTEHFSLKKDASDRERQVKKWKSRKLIEKLISSS